MQLQVLPAAQRQRLSFARQEARALGHDGTGSIITDLAQSGQYAAISPYLPCLLCNTTQPYCFATDSILSDMGRFQAHGIFLEKKVPLDWQRLIAEEDLTSNALQKLIGNSWHHVVFTAVFLYVFGCLEKIEEPQS